jgi:AcrR family transcriptional regulator
MVKPTTRSLWIHTYSQPAVDAMPATPVRFGAFERAIEPAVNPQADARATAGAIAPAGRMYRGLTPDERRAVRRQRLLDVGLASFGTVGFGATTIEQLCSDAGVTPRHFYEAFSSREALLLAVYDEAVRFTHEAAQAAVAAAGRDPKIRTRASIEAFVHAMCDDPRRARVLCIEGVLSGEFERHRREVIHTFADLTAAQMRELAPNVDTPPRIRPMVLLGVIHELVVEWLLSDSPPPLDQLIDELTGFWLAASQLPA